MMNISSLQIDSHTFTSIEVNLPKTNLLVVTTETGYVMCGALDVDLLRNKLGSRGIIAARAVGVKTMRELLDGSVESCTQAAEALGIVPGMPIRDALVAMKRAEL